jgi:hypothetical protein
MDIPSMLRQPQTVVRGLVQLCLGGTELVHSDILSQCEPQVTEASVTILLQ